jgi:hypothetical protein
LCICCRRHLFIESLPSNGRVLWLHYSGLQASCHIMTTVNSSRFG